MISQAPRSSSSTRSARAFDAQRTRGRPDGHRGLALAGQKLRAAGAPRILLGDEPAGEALEARPPEGAFGGGGQKIGQMLFAQSFELVHGIGRQHARWMRAEKLVERIVQGIAAIGGAQLGFQRIEGLQYQDAAGIETIGIAPPLLDA